MANVCVFVTIAIALLNAECKFRTEVNLTIGLKPDFRVQIQLSYKTFSLKSSSSKR